tara:strand:+ start:299 stop:514 length:216 start_codon:yes stop_codon:yes gene_type:complete
MKLAAHPRVNERGLLNSVYKQEIKRQAGHMKQASISRIKGSIVHHHEAVLSKAGTVVQVSLFVIVTAVFLF